MLKKFFVIFFVLVMALTACAKQEEVKPETKRNSTGTYYFLAGNNSDPFYIPGVAGFEAAGKAVGMKTSFVGPMDLNTTEQMKTFEQLVASPETAGIFWYPMDFNQGEIHIKEAKKKGIPMVIGAADSPYKTRDAFIGYDNLVLGKQAAEWAATLIGCKGSVGTMSNDGPNLLERTSSFSEHIKTLCPDVVVHERASHDGSATSGAGAIETYLVAYPDLSLLWFADGAAGQQAQLWKDKQATGLKTLFLATDMPPITLDAVKEGIFIGSVGQDTYTEEYWGVLLLDALNKGQRVPDTIYLSIIRIDLSNVDQFIED